MIDKINLADGIPRSYRLTCRPDDTDQIHSLRDTTIIQKAQMSDGSKGLASSSLLSHSIAPPPLSLSPPCIFGQKMCSLRTEFYIILFGENLVCQIWAKEPFPIPTTNCLE